MYTAVYNYCCDETKEGVVFKRSSIRGIENLIRDVLTYVLAVTPAVGWEAFYEAGPLRPEPDRERERTD
jgi:hypothetical protein